MRLKSSQLLAKAPRCVATTYAAMIGGGRGLNALVARAAANDECIRTVMGWLFKLAMLD